MQIITDVNTFQESMTVIGSSLLSFKVQLRVSGYDAQCMPVCMPVCACVGCPLEGYFGSGPV